jgi:glycosyltransferase involved in cell wall biosynthesis
MPWRTVLEVAQGLRLRGHNVLVVSVSDRSNPPPFVDGDRVVTLTRQGVGEMRRALDAALSTHPVDVVFLPISWSGNTLMCQILNGIGTIRIGYLPGSAFEFRHLVRVVGKMSFRSLLPYLAQSLYPQRLFARALAELNLRGLITNSDYSTRCLAASTGIPVMTIAPGRDPIETFSPGGIEPAVLLSPAPYFLFMGPPLSIRGIYVLLDAYSRIADETDIPPLLCLFRSDAHLDMATLRARIEQRWTHDKIHFVWKSLPPQVLQGHIQMAAAVIMPFLIVPSEIPLAVYEAAGLGKTVITTGPHGTADFVSSFGECVYPGDADGLAAAMRKVAQRIASREDSDNAHAHAAFRALDDWQTVADRWGDLAEQTITTNTFTRTAGETTTKIASS